MKLLIPIVAAVAMADERDINHEHISANREFIATVDALPANLINFVDQAYNVRPIVNKWKPVNNVGQVQYADSVEIAEKQPTKYYNGAQYNNGYAGYNGYNGNTGYNGYNGYKSNAARYNTGYNTGYNTAYNTAYNTGYNNYRVPYMQNTYNQYKPVEKIVEKIEDIKHHIEDHREEHDDIIEEVQVPTYGKPYGKPFFGKPEIKENQGKYSSITGKYYNPYQNNVKVVDKVVKEEYRRPINNGFYNNYNNYVQRPVQQIVQQVARPVQYVQQQNDQDWFNTFLTYYALTKNSDVVEDV